MIILNVGVFKLRKSIYANEAFKLDYVLTDGKLLVLLITYRTQLNPNGGAEVNQYFIENASDNSQNVEVVS